MSYQFLVGHYYCRGRWQKYARINWSERGLKSYPTGMTSINSHRSLGKSYLYCVEPYRILLHRNCVLLRRICWNHTSRGLIPHKKNGGRYDFSHGLLGVIALPVCIFWSHFACLLVLAAKIRIIALQFVFASHVSYKFLLINLPSTFY